MQEKNKHKEGEEQQERARSKEVASDKQRVRSGSVGPSVQEPSVQG